MSVGLVPALYLPSMLRSVFVGRQVRAYVRDAVNERRSLSIVEVAASAIHWRREENDWALEVSALRNHKFLWGTSDREPRTLLLSGGRARAALWELLPVLNARGGAARTVQAAVSVLERASDPARLPGLAARHHARYAHAGAALRELPVEVRLALEMAANEDTERRALEGELHLLADAWREVEEIAGIADHMFVPASVDEAFARLKRNRGD